MCQLDGGILNHMEACPNIGGREIRRRTVFGYIGLSLTLVLILYVVLFNGPTYLKGLIFITSLSTIIPFMEARSETCIVNAYFGVKNMGTKYQKEKDMKTLKAQQKDSISIMVKGTLVSIIITTLIFYV